VYGTVLPYSCHTASPAYWLLDVRQKMDSKTKRSKLVPRREPYWFRLRTGAHLGYRKLEQGEGTWIAKWRDEAGKRHYKALGTILDDSSRSAFDKARRECEAWFNELERGASPKGETVEDICKLYVENRRKHVGERNANDAEGRFRRLVYDKPIGRKELSKLKPLDVERWLFEQIPDEDEVEDPDQIRRAKDSANRNLVALKAALNRALESRLISSDFAWRTVKAFEKVSRRRERFLEPEQRRKLLNACPADLRALCTALLLTAARPGEIVAAKIPDFDAKQGTLILQGKTGRRTVSLSSAAIAFFAEQTCNRIGKTPLVHRADGKPWDRFSWRDPFKEAVKAAKLPHDVVLYSLRHAAISEMLIAGIDATIVARLAGTSTAMIDKHYGHLIHDRTRAKLDAVKAL
jgi:integrase